MKLTGNVAVDPFQGSFNVENVEVLRSAGQLSRVRGTEDRLAIVEVDVDDVLGSKVATLPLRVAGAASDHSTSVNVNEDLQRR